MIETASASASGRPSAWASPPHRIPPPQSREYTLNVCPIFRVHPSTRLENRAAIARRLGLMRLKHQIPCTSFSGAPEGLLPDLQQNGKADKVCRRKAVNPLSGVGARRPAAVFQLVAARRSTGSMTGLSPRSATTTTEPRQPEARAELSRLTLKSGGEPSTMSRCVRFAWGAGDPVRGSGDVQRASD